MKIKLDFRYEVDAEETRGESAADEDRMMEIVSRMVERFAETVADSAHDEGLTVTVVRG